MSLKEARRIVKTYRKEDYLGSLQIIRDKAACDLANPSRHRMSGNYVVRVYGQDGSFVRQFSR